MLSGPTIAQLFGASFALCLLILVTMPLHGRFSIDSGAGIQKIHEHPAPRIGGVAIFVALMIGFYSLEVADPTRKILRDILLASLPIFSIGLAEDFTKRVSVFVRLLVALSSGVFLVVSSTIALKSLGLGGWEEELLAFRPLAIGITAFAIAGLVNAINLIDGVNGLAAIVSIILLAALGAIAYLVSDLVLAKACFFAALPIAGFLIFNWPLGKIFLGDGGAYLLGFVIAWLAILLPIRNPEVSPWVSLLVLFYPVAETVFTLLRRQRLARHLGAPDRLHLHTLIKKRVINPRYKTMTLTARNSLAGLICSVFALIPAALAVLFFNHPQLLIACVVLGAFLYWIAYRRLSVFRWF